MSLLPRPLTSTVVGPLPRWYPQQIAKTMIWASQKHLPLQIRDRCLRTSILRLRMANCDGLAAYPLPVPAVFVSCGDSDGYDWLSPQGCYCSYKKVVAAWPGPGARLRRPPRRSRPSSSRMRGTRRLGPLCHLRHLLLPPYYHLPRPETIERW